jgi:hypothetical protein
MLYPDTAKRSARGCAGRAGRWRRRRTRGRPSTRGLLNANELFRFFGEPAEALRLKQELLPLLRGLSPERHYPATMTDVAEILAETGEFEEARRTAAEAVSRRRELGVATGIGHALGGLAMVECRAGNFARARELSQEALELAEEPHVPTDAFYSLLLAESRHGDSAIRTMRAPACCAPCSWLGSSACAQSSRSFCRKSRLSPPLQWRVPVCSAPRSDFVQSWGCRGGTLPGTSRLRRVCGPSSESAGSRNHGPQALRWPRTRRWRSRLHA